MACARWLGMLVVVAGVGLGACSGRTGGDSTSSSSSGGGSSSSGVPPAWACSPLVFQDGQTCDCGCGAVDPDCGALGCQEPNCSRPACSFCYDAQGRAVSCGASSGSSSSGAGSSRASTSVGMSSSASLVASSAAGSSSSTVTSSVGSSSAAGSSSSGAAGSSSSDPCAGHVTYQGVVPDQSSVWTSAGLTGLAAGHLMCQGVGADHVCDYEELLVARAAGEFSAVVQGTTAWVHRTTTARVDGQDSPAGEGGRCVNWVFNGNHLADGEYATFDQAGVITFHLDGDTVYDPGSPGQHVVAGDLDCGGVMRNILCCNAACP